MKVNKHNPLHWLLLLAFGVNIVCAMMLRPFLYRGRRDRVLLYGHRRSGNLLALEEFAASNPVRGLRFAFLTMDKKYHRHLRDNGIASVLAISPTAIPWLASANAVISDHGLHSMELMLYWSDIKFFDVWHGIPFKGFDPDDFRVQHRYCETWVTSALLKEMYVDRFGFEESRVVATGNPRTDLLASARNDTMVARGKFGLPLRKRVVLFAPTWKQDSQGRSLFPFGTTQQEFLSLLERVASKHDAVVAVRTHFNSGIEDEDLLPGMLHLPFGRFPDTERLLASTDVLVCDWSSIAFDFLVLRRPTIFLDVDPPFSKGFSLGPSYRYGEVVAGVKMLEGALTRYLWEPDAYWREHGTYAESILNRVYGDSDDGHAASRCIDRLLRTTH